MMNRSYSFLRGVIIINCIIICSNNREDIHHCIMQMKFEVEFKSLNHRCIEFDSKTDCVELMVLDTF